MKRDFFGNSRAARLLALVALALPTASRAVTTTGYEDFGDTAGVQLWRTTTTDSGVTDFAFANFAPVDVEGNVGETYTQNGTDNSTIHWRRWASKFLNGSNSYYTAPGLVLVYDQAGLMSAPSKGATFTPVSFGGMWVKELGANNTPYGITDEANKVRVTEFGATGYSTLFKFDKSYTINRGSASTFYGTATVSITGDAVFTAATKQYTVVDVDATLKLTGDSTGALNVGNGLIVNGSLDLSAETCPTIDGNVTLADDSTLAVPEGTELPFEICSGTLNASGLVYVKVGEGEPSPAELTVSGGTITAIDTEIQIEQTFTENWPDTVPAGYTYTYVGGATAEDTVLVPSVTVNGTLKTSGYIAITNLAVASSASLEVLGDNTIVGGSSDRQLKGNITIDSGATLTNTRTDTLDYHGSMTVDIFGTLDLGNTRWSIPENCRFNLHAGARVNGSGDAYGALDLIRSTGTGIDVYGAGDNVEGSVTIEGQVRIRYENTRFWIAEGMTLILEGGLRDGFDDTNCSFRQVGPGTMEVHKNSRTLHDGCSTFTQGTLRLVDTTLAFPVELQNSNSYLEIVATDTDTTVPVEIYCIDQYNNNNVSFSGAGKVSGEIYKMAEPAGELLSLLQSEAWEGTLYVNGVETDPPIVNVPVPLAVWVAGEFDDDKSAHGGLEFALNGNTIDSNGNIVIGNDTTLGATVAVPTGTLPRMTMLVKYSVPAGGAPVAQSVPASLFSTYDLGALAGTGSSTLAGYWLNGSTVYTGSYAFSNPAQTMPQEGYLLISNWTKTPNNGDHGTAVYSGETLSTLAGGEKTGLRFTGADKSITAIGVGGPTVAGAKPWAGMVIESVALFDEWVATNVIANYKFPAQGAVQPEDSDRYVVEPVVSWVNDFKTTTKGDYTLSVSGTTTAKDDAFGGTLTIGDAAAIIDTTAASSTKMTVLIKYRAASSVVSAPVVAFGGMAAVGLDVGVYTKSDKTLAVYRNFSTDNTKPYDFGTAPQLSATGGYVLCARDNGQQCMAYVGDSLDAMTGGTVSDGGIKFSNITLTKLGIGGNSGMAANANDMVPFAGLEIEKIVVFNGYYTPDQIRYIPNPEDGDTVSISDNTTWTFTASDTPREYLNVGTLSSSGTIAIANASELTEGTYSLATWSTPQQYTTQCAGYGKVGTLVTDGLAEGLSARLIYGARGIYLRVDDTAKQAARKPLVVWCYGDSITEGFNAQATGANYRILLYQKLEMLGYKVKSTGVYGLSNGYNSVDPSGTPLTDQYRWHSAKHGATAGPTTLAHRSNLSENVDTLAIQAGTPDVALLLIGVNDIPEWKSESDRVAPVFKAWTNVVSRMVKNLPDTKIVVSTILYSDGTRTDIDPTITAINTQIKNLLDNLPAEWQGHVFLADLNSYVKSGETGIIYNDHLHPDWWGYDQMADGYLDKIVECYPNPDATDFPSQNPIPAAPAANQLGAANKPELAAYRAGFSKLCNIRVEKGQDVSNVVYDDVNGEAASENLEKVGYFVEFVRDDNHAHKWVWVDMDAFGDADLASVGLPQRNYQQAVTRMHVCSNHGAIDNVAADDDSVTGWIEFSPYDYTRTGSNSAAPANYGEPFDWNDTLSESGSYGCMQVFRVMNPSSRDLYERPQLMFAFNNFQSQNSNPADFGIGNFAQHFNCNNSYHTEDWTGVGGTLAKMAPDAYSVKTIEIWTKASGEEKSEFFSGRLADTPYNDGLGSNSSGRYRIPAIAKSTNDVVVAIYDCRYNGSGDLPNALDSAESWSGDGGRTWSQPRIGIDVPNTNAYVKSCNFGDPCILFDPDGNKFWAMGITGGGLASPRDNNGNSISDVVLYTRGTGANDEWKEWTGGPDGNKRSIKQMILDALAEVDLTANSDENQIRGILQGPGHGMVQQKTVTNELGEVIMPAGALVFPMQYFSSFSNFIDAMTFAVYSTDGGTTWQSTKLTQSDQNAQENCVMELDDGSWYMICKGRTNSDKRRQLFRTTNYKDWTYCGSLTPSEWVQGSCLRLGRGANGTGRYVACFSPSGRSNITLYFGRDTTAADPVGNGIEWNYVASTNIYPYSTGGMGYNSLVMLDDTTLGVLLETNGHIELLTVDVSNIVVPATPDTSAKARVDGVEYETVFAALMAAYIGPEGTVVEVLDDDYDIDSENPDVLLYFVWEPETRTFTRQNAVIENVIEGVDVLNVSIDGAERTATFTLRINIDASADEDTVRANLLTKGIAVYKGNTLDDLDFYHVELLSDLVGSDSTDMLYIAQLDEADTKFYRFAVSDGDSIVSSDIICISNIGDGYIYYTVQPDEPAPDQIVIEDMWYEGIPLTVSEGETIRFDYNLFDIDEMWFGEGDGTDYKVVLAMPDSFIILDEDIHSDWCPNRGSFDWTANVGPGNYVLGFVPEDLIIGKGTRRAEDICGFEVTVVANGDPEPTVQSMVTVIAGNSTLTGAVTGSYASGTVLEFAVEPNIGYTLVSVTANGDTITPDGTGKYSVTVGEVALQIVVNTTQIDPSTMSELNVRVADAGGSPTFSDSSVVVLLDVEPTDVTKTYLRSDSWTGTVFIKDVDKTDIDPTAYGNPRSTLRLSGVKGYWKKGVFANSATPAIELVNSETEERAYGFFASNGYSFYSNGSYNYVHTPELKGSGEYHSEGPGDRALLVVDKWDAFTGKLHLWGKAVWFGTGEPEQNSDTVALVRPAEVRLGSTIPANYATANWYIPNGYYGTVVMTNAANATETAFLTSPSKWKGTCQLAWNPSNTALDIVNYGNANSVIEITTDFGAYPTQNGGSDGAEVAAEVKIDEGVTWTVSNGWTGENYRTTFAKLSGAGTLMVNGANGGIGAPLPYTITRLEGFTGTIAGARGQFTIGTIVAAEEPVPGTKLVNCTTTNDPIIDNTVVTYDGEIQVVELEFVPGDGIYVKYEPVFDPENDIITHECVLRISEIMPKPTDDLTLNGRAGMDLNGLESGWVEVENTSTTEWANLADYKFSRTNRGKKSGQADYGNFPSRLVPPGGRAIFYTSERYSNSKDKTVSAFADGTFDGTPMIFEDYGNILVWGDKVNPKKSPYVRLYYAPDGTVASVVDTVVVPSDLPEGWSIIVGDAAEGEGTRRWMCPTPTRNKANTATDGLTRIGPNVGPLYEISTLKKTDVANEFVVPTPPAVPGEDYVVTLPINPVMNPNGTFEPREVDQILSIKFVYRKDLDDATLVTNDIDMATKTTDKKAWGDQYTATIPASYFPAAGHLMQWKVLITDGEGVEWTSPSFNNKDDGYEWYGTIVEPGELNSATLPTWHMFVDDASKSQMDYDKDDSRYTLENGARVAIYDSSTSNYYDYVRIDLRGHTSGSFTKKGHGLRFAKAHPLTMRDIVSGEDIEEIRKTSLISEYADPSYMRQMIAFWLWRKMGNLVPFDFPVRCNLNGEFYQLAFNSERFTDELIEDVYGLDKFGYGYKNVGTLKSGTGTSAGSIEKKTPDDEDESNVTVLQNELRSKITAAQSVSSSLDGGDTGLDNAALTKFVVQKFDLPAWLNYLASAKITQEMDDVWANVCAYYDNPDMLQGARGKGTWMPLGYDFNLSFGQYYQDSGVYVGTLMSNQDWFKSHPFYGGNRVRCYTSAAMTSAIGNGNDGFEAVWQSAKFRRLYLRRLRTLMDQELKEPDTPEGDTPFMVKMRELADLMRADAALDLARWPDGNSDNVIDSWRNGTRPADMDAGIQDIWNNYVVPRREHLYVTHSVNSTEKAIGYGSNLNAGIPEAQSSISVLAPNICITNLTTLDEEEAESFGVDSLFYDTDVVEIHNGNDEVVDMSGWRLSDAVDFTFPAGTVCDANDSIYIVADRRAYIEAHDEGLTDQVIVGNAKFIGEGPRAIALYDAEGTLVFAKAPKTDEASYLRLHSFCGNTAASGGDTGEWFVLTNISETATLDLAGVTVCFLKQGDDHDTTTHCHITLENKKGSGSLAPLDSMRFNQADWTDKGWPKIQNNKLDIKIYDKYGSLCQSLKVTQKDYTFAYGNGGYLVCDSTEASVDGKNLWHAEPRFTVTFDAGESGKIDGATTKELTVDWNTTLGEESIPVPTPNEGYVFAEWTGDDLNAPVTNDVTFIAQYTLKTYECTIGGATTTYKHGDVVTFPAPVDPVSEAGGIQVLAVGTSYDDIGVTNEFTLTITGPVSFDWDILATNYWFGVPEIENGSVAAPDADWLPSGTNFTLTATAAENYHFVGWTGDTNGCEVVEGGLSVTMDQARTIGAAFAIDTFTVTFDAGEHGTLEGETAQTIDYGATAVVPEVTPDAGYEFMGWSGDVTAPVISNATFAAQYAAIPYAITYTGLMGATNPNPATYTVEDQVAFENPGAVYGWVFTGWEPEGIAPGTTGDVEVSAKWERAKFNVTVNGETRQCSYEDVVTFPAPEPWEADGMQIVALGTTFTDPVVTNAVTVTVTNGIEFAWDILATNYWFEVPETENGAVAAPDAGWLPSGTNFTLTATAAENYHFVGWTGDTNGCEVVEGGLSVTMDQPRTIGAAFAIDTFAVTFDAGAHGALSGETAQTIDYGSAAVAPTVTPDDGYTFTGWSCGFSEVTGDLTVTAQYAPISYCITYTGLMGATNPNPATYTVEDEVAFENPGAVYGWVFAGWTPASIALGSTGDVEVSAKWERAKFNVTVNGETRQYSYEDVVTFPAPVDPVSEADGIQVLAVGTSYDDIGVTNEFTLTITGPVSFDWDILATNYWFEVPETENGAVSAPEAGWMPAGTNFTLTAIADGHYHFVGWTGDTNGCEVVEGGLSVTMDQARTIGAAFAIDTFTVTFDAGEHGTLEGELSQTIDYGSAAVAPTVTPDDGYTFTGWSCGFSEVTGDLTVTAQYAAIPYAIAYTGLMGATNPNPATYTVEDQVAFENPGAVYGWVFTGWEPEGIAPGTTGDVEVSAKWERAKFDVTVNGETRQYSYEDEVTFAAPEPWEADGMQIVALGTTFTDPVVTNAVTVTVTNGIEFAWDILATNYWFEVPETENGAVSAPEAGWLPSGTNFTLTATAAENYHFVGWTGDTNGCEVVSETGLAVVMDRPRTIGAEFALIPITIGEAVEADNLDWALDDSTWSVVYTASAVTNGTAAYSGSIGSGEKSVLEVNLDGAGTLSFWWRTSCNEKSDALRLEIDGANVRKISGTNEWLNVTVDLGLGEHRVRWVYSKGRKASVTDDGAWLDNVAWTSTPQPTIAQAIGEFEWELETATYNEEGERTVGCDGNIVWKGAYDEGEFGVACEGNSFAIAKGLGNDVESVLRTRVVGAGRIEFHWAVSCEEGYDWLEFYVNGEYQTDITGESETWEKVSIDLGEGTNVLEWVYWKDEMDDPELVGSNCAMLDYVRWFPKGEEPPEIHDVELEGFFAWLKEHGQLTESASIEDAAEIRKTSRTALGKRSSLFAEYVTGTDPENPDDEFTVNIEVVDGQPVVTFSPDTEELRATRTYTLLGNKSLDADGWQEVEKGKESDYNFFKVVVELN